jgi:ATP-dependent helicase/nuclease subunit B
VSTASIWALCEHLKLGEYTPTAAEEQILTKDKIVLDNGKKLSLTGIVDRVDVLETGGETYVKIIDYKSGATKFNLDEVRQGVQLQLMLYMNVILAQRGAKPGGMFYFPIDDPILSTDIALSDEMREAGLLKQFKMSGVALAEDAVMAGLDKTLAPGVSSDVIPVGKNKDGRFSKASQGATLGLDEFLALGQEVDAVIKNLGQRMTCGDISAVPYTKGAKSPCQFCGYGAICRKKG